MGTPASSPSITAAAFGSFSTRFAPIILLEAYLGFTVFLYFFGPVEWHIPNAAQLLGFLAFNYGCLWFGYRWGVKHGPDVHADSPTRQSGKLVVRPYMLHLILFSMLFTIFATTVKLLAIRGSFSEVLATVTNPGEAYIQAQLIAQLDRDGETLPIQGYSYLFRICTVLSVFQGLFLPLALACWRRLPRLHRSLFFVALLFLLLYGIGIGAQSGFGFLLFSTLPVVLFKVFVQRPILKVEIRQRIRASRMQGAVKLAGASMLAIIVLIAIVAFFQLDRAESSGLELSANTALVGSHGTPVTRGFPLFEDDPLSFGVVMACKYISHGYTGLALAMEMPFEWTYGLGTSKGLQVILRDYLGGPDIFERSYLVRSDQVNDWPSLVWWSTIFPWIASDTTFYGTFLVMIAIGFALGRLWRRLISFGDPIALVPLAQLFILVFMFPANNALLQTLDGVFSFVGMIAVYLLGTYLFGSRPTVGR